MTKLFYITQFISIVVICCSCERSLHRISLENDPFLNHFIKLINSRDRESFITIQHPQSENFIQVLYGEETILDLVITLSTTYDESKITDTYVNESGLDNLKNFLERNGIEYQTEKPKDENIEFGNVSLGEKFQLRVITAYVDFDSSTCKEIFLGIFNQVFHLQVTDVDELNIRTDKLWLPITQ